MDFIRENAPCYVYDQAMIRRACRQLKADMPDFEFLYSIKTNPFGPVIRTVAEEGFGADAASVREVEKSLAAGIPAERICYSAPGRTEREIRRVWGRCLFIADSFHDLETVEKIAREKGETAVIGLRVHPLFVMGAGSRGPSKFGIDLQQMETLKTVLGNCPDVRIIGMHVHLRSQVLDAGILAQYYHDVMAAALTLQTETGNRIQFINFGSGIGVAYDAQREQPVDLAALAAEAGRLAAENAGGIRARLMIETGRFVVCQAGRYYTPVVDRKVSQGITYLICPNGLNGFMRPAIASLVAKAAGGREVPGMEPLYTGPDEFEVRVINDSKETETVSIVGNLCTAMDVIRDHVTVRKAEIGDLVEITNAGSYACTLSPLAFASQEFPREFLHTEDGHWEEK